MTMSFRLSEEEKREILEDAADPKRREDFRKLRELKPRVTFEEYVSWLTQIHALFPPPPRRYFKEYKNVLI